MDCVIIGAGGHGRVVLDVLRQQTQHNVVGFLDSNSSLHGQRMDGVQVLGSIDLVPMLQRNGIRAAFVAIGENGIRRQFMEIVIKSGLELINAVHPSANIASNVNLGRGVLVAAGALVCAHCQIGDGVILNTGSIVDHETMISTCVHVCPGAKLAGRVTVESGAFIGIGATIIQRVRVGHDATVGAGSVVLCDVEPMSTVVGVPARHIKGVTNADDFQHWPAYATRSNS
ncbi:MAG: putative acetyltransferase EpsM [Phycisphaerae bacterium]|nr:putative acetyltransferase EpsM [Phycisphaerae bacterium]